MLLLSRSIGERIIIETADGPITITLCETSGSQARLGIDAPRHVAVHREEISQRIKKEHQA